MGSNLSAGAMIWGPADSRPGENILIRAAFRPRWISPRSLKGVRGLSRRDGANAREGLRTQIAALLDDKCGAQEGGGGEA